MPTRPKRKASVELKNKSDDNEGFSDEDNGGSSDEDNVGSSDEEGELAVLLATLSMEAEDFDIPDGWRAEQLETKQQQCARCEEWLTVDQFKPSHKKAGEWSKSCIRCLKKSKEERIQRQAEKPAEIKQQQSDDGYEHLSNKELGALCQDRGLPIKGTNDQLRARLTLSNTMSLEWSQTDISTPLPKFERPSGPSYLNKPGRRRSIGRGRGRVGDRKEIDFFQMLVTSEVIDLLVEETIRYAHQRISATKKKCDPNFTTDAIEMMAFIGVMIWMGWKRLPQMRMYWSTDHVIGCPEISKHWTQRLLCLFPCVQ